MLKRFCDSLSRSARVVTDQSASLVSELRELQHSIAEGASVAIAGDALHLLRWLYALDGIARRVVVVPRSADRELWSMVIATGEVNCCALEATFLSEEVSQLFEKHGVRLLTEATFGSSGVTNGTIAPAVHATEWVLTTSGTTSTPKLVAHTLDSLTRSMKLEPRFAEFRWGLLYDPARFAGMQVFLQALLNGATLLAPGSDLPLAAQIAWLSENGCDALSATPTLWRKILMTSESKALVLRQVTLGGEIADEPTIRALTHRFAGARLTHVYASTEAGVGFAVHDGRAGFPREWLEQTVRGIRLKMGGNGCLWVAPPQIQQRYLNSGIADSVISGDDGWIDTGDVIRIDGDRVYFSGRLNGSINVGGNKVFPEEIETVVLEVPGVAAATARGRANSVMGSLVEVLIVRQADAPVDLAARVKAHCKQKLEGYKVPAFVKQVDDIGVTSAGKTVR